MANAGGINPEGCAAALKQILGEKSKDLKIAVVTGDNLIDRVGFMNMVSNGGVFSVKLSYHCSS